MAWYCRTNGGSIWRCSQPKVGIANSSVDDEVCMCCSLGLFATGGLWVVVFD
jgi:hypothetical protein